MSLPVGRTRQKKIGTKAVLGLTLFLLLLLDSYALYSIYVERMGNRLDFYPFWAGGREVLIRGENPYQPEVMLRIQTAIYGRPALPDENQHGYAYPAYSPLIVAPFLILPFSESASLWIALQQFLIVASVVLTAHATRWKMEPWRMLLLCLAAMTFRYAMISFVLGQTATWVLFGLSLALWAASQRRATLAGVALAAGLLKPQLVVLPALALLACSRPPERKRMLLSLGGAVILLLLLSWLLAGFWLPDYWDLLQAYRGYSATEFPIEALASVWLPPQASQILNVAAVAGLLALLMLVLWRARGTGRVAMAAALAVVIGQLVVPQTGSYNLTLLILPSVVILGQLHRIRKRSWLSLAGRLLVWGSLAVVPWLLWPIVNGPDGIPLDEVVLPALLLLTMAGLLMADRKDTANLQPLNDRPGAS